MIDDRTPRAKQLVAMMHSTMNIDFHEMVEAGVMADTCVQGHSAWTKWNNDAPMFIVKLDAKKLNALAALIMQKFPSAFGDNILNGE
jgi:cell fate (sporulation/competence/biofilm development) regulator YmcA (YheA/YmcA/DUF963 family)